MSCGHSLRDEPCAFTSIVEVVSKIEDALEMLTIWEIPCFERDECEKLFWTLIIGGITSSGHAYGYVEHS